MSVNGKNAQRGFQFQAVVGLSYALDLLIDKDLMTVDLESTGVPKSTEVIFVDDIVLSYRQGYKRFVQVKLSAEGAATWNMNALHRKGELGKIVKQLRSRSADFVELICPDGFGDLDRLKADVSKFHDHVAFDANAGKEAKARLRQFCALALIDEEQAFSCLRRLSIGTQQPLRDWENEVLRKLAQHHVEAPQQAMNILLKLVTDHQCGSDGAPGILTAEVLARKLNEYGVWRSELQDGPPVQEDREWKGERIVMHNSLPMDLKPIGQDDLDIVKWAPYGPQFILALRPRAPAEPRLIDLLEDKFGSDPDTLPTFLPSSSKVTARIKNGLCSYQLWTKPARSITTCQKVLSIFSARFRPAERRCFAMFTYLGSNGEIWLSYAFRLKSGYRNNEGVQPLPSHIEQLFATALDNARGVMRVLGEKGTYEGMAYVGGGIRNSVLQLLGEDGVPTKRTTSPCDKTSIRTNFVIPADEMPSGRALQPFFEALWESLRTRRPLYYDHLHSTAVDEF